MISHLPHQVANNYIDCYTKLSKYKQILEHKYVEKNVTIDKRCI